MKNTAKQLLAMARKAQREAIDRGDITKLTAAEKKQIHADTAALERDIVAACINVAIGEATSGHIEAVHRVEVSPHHPQLVAHHRASDNAARLLEDEHGLRAICLSDYETGAHESEDLIVFTIVMQFAPKPRNPRRKSPKKSAKKSRAK